VKHNVSLNNFKEPKQEIFRMREIQNHSMVFKSYFDYNQRVARKKFVLGKCLCSTILGGKFGQFR
jgi:hypothetical protein